MLLLRRQIARKFGDDTAGQLDELLDDLNSLDNIDRVTDALIECATEQEFVERMRMTWTAVRHRCARNSHHTSYHITYRTSRYGTNYPPSPPPGRSTDVANSSTSRDDRSRTNRKWPSADRKGMPSWFSACGHAG